MQERNLRAKQAPGKVTEMTREAENECRDRSGTQNAVLTDPCLSVIRPKSFDWHGHSMFQI